MRRIIELTDREIDEAREYGLNTRLRNEGFKIAMPGMPIRQEPTKDGTRFIQDE